MTREEFEKEMELEIKSVLGKHDDHALYRKAAIWAYNIIIEKEKEKQIQAKALSRVLDNLLS